MLFTYNIAPIPQLRPFVNNIWVVDAKNLTHPHLEKMIPYGCSDFIYVQTPALHYHANGTVRKHIEQFFITGQVTKPYHLEYSPGSKIIGFGFYPHTAHLFSKFSSHEFTDGLVALQNMGLNNKLNQISTQLDKTSHFEQRIMLLQNFVLNQIQENYQKSPKLLFVQTAVQRTLGSKGHINLKDICSELNISNRFLQNSFKEYVGVSPVLFSKIIRFLNAIDLLQKSPSTLTEKGLQLGYYDQSHFIRDFKRFSGLSPKKYLQEKHYLLDEFTSSESHSFLYNSIR